MQYEEEGAGDRVSSSSCRQIQSTPPGRDTVAANICVALWGLGMFKLKNNIVTEVFLSSISGMATKCIIEYAKDYIIIK